MTQEAVSPDLALPLDDDTLPGDEDDDGEEDDVNDEDYVAERAPVIDDDEEDGEMGEVDMDVVMNVEVERVSQGIGEVGFQDLHLPPCWSWQCL